MFLSILFVFMGLVVQPTVMVPAHANPPEADVYVQTVITLINAERATLNLAPLAEDSSLRAATMWHAQDMANHNYTGFIDSLGRDTEERLVAFGYSNFSGSMVWSTGPDSGEDAFNVLKSKYRDSFVNKDVYHIGVGYGYNSSSDQHYWSYIFSTRQSNPTPTNTPTVTVLPTTPTPTTVPVVTPPPIATRSWTFMLYLNGDTAIMDYGQVHTHMSSALQSLGQSFNANVHVIALIDGPESNDTRRVVFDPHRREQSVAEQAMDAPETLISFVQAAQQEFPADAYYLAIANHANGIDGISWDTTTAGDKSALLTPRKLRQALVAITDNGVHPIDVLHFDGCSFGLLENATIARGLARYVVSSQNLSLGFFAYSEYRAAIGSTTTPAELAVAVAQRYAHHSDEQQLPYTISALDMSRLDVVIEVLNGFADGLTAFAATNQTNRDTLKDLRNQSQKFLSVGGLPTKITNDNSYVDLVDFALRVKPQVNDHGVPAAADSLVAAIGSTQQPGFVIYEAHRGGSFTYGDGKDRNWNLSGAHGVSIYYPYTAYGTKFDDYVKGRTFQEFATINRWSNYLQSGAVPFLTPGETIPTDDPDPLTPLLPTGTYKHVYLPLIIR
jgi:hypothetical protein